MPLDISCNPHLKNPFHTGSCINAQYASAAKNQGKFWEVESLLFEKSPSSEEEILSVLKEADFGLDLEKLQKDANSKEIKDEIKVDMDYAASQGKIGTPSLKIGDDFEMGVKGYPRLKEWVKEHGGIERHGLFQ
jgi:protein-disulfide isomerase